MTYKNKKNGQNYRVLFSAVEATNGKEGTEIVVYTRKGIVYTRERQEFDTKFEPTKSFREYLPLIAFYSMTACTAYFVWWLGAHSLNPGWALEFAIVGGFFSKTLSQILEL